MRSLPFFLLLAVLLTGCGTEAPSGDGTDLSGSSNGDLAGQVTPKNDLSMLPANTDSSTGQDSGPDSGSGTDLSALSDLAALADLTVLRDLSVLPDLVPPPDLLPPPDLVPEPCATQCPNGCCNGNSCVMPDPNLGCAVGGAACQACAAGAADRCLGGNCSCGPSGMACPAGLACVGGACQCTPASCASGCCADSVTCIAMPTAQLCGRGGASCMDCTPTGNACVNGACKCNGVAPCAAHAVCDNAQSCICDRSSCGSLGQCFPISLTACGVAGGACMTCDPRKADRCDPNSGLCQCGANLACGQGLFCDTKGTPTCRCDITPMTGCTGCCTADGTQCIVTQNDVDCGIHGATCQDCSALGDTCSRVDGSCQSCAQRCAGANNGCCTGTVCTTLAQQTSVTGCGGGGVACVSCGITADRCIAGVCSCGGGGRACASGLECINGQCACDPNSCPTGCCQGGVCQTIKLATCGANGGACAACDANLTDTCLNGACSCGNSGVVCSAGTQCVNGQCACTAAACPTGCCFVGLCLIPEPGHCGTGGNACNARDPATADTCSNGTCMCGTNPACGADLTCVSGVCRCKTDPCSTCTSAATTRSYIGCEYWPTTLANTVWSIFDFAIAVANPQATAATVTVTGPGNFSTTATVAAGSLAKIYLPWVADLKGADGNACGNVSPGTASVSHPGGAYHVTSTLPVTVYQFNALEYAGQGGPVGKSWAACPGTATRCISNNFSGFIGCFSFSNDASLLLPTTAMTGSYRVTGVHGWTAGNPASDIMGTYIGITGTTNNTQVTIKTSATGAVLTGGAVPAIAANSMATLTINAGDVLELLTPRGAAHDLSGSLVTANNPVQVISGIECINNPANNAACDHVEESIFPAETLGKHYAVTVPTGPNGTPVGVTVRFYGNFANTNLTYVPAVAGAPATLAAGQVVELPGVVNDFVVTGDQPFAVGTIMLGASIVDPNTQPPNQKGDPSQSQAVAIEQYRTNYIFLAPNDYTVNYADIVAPTGATLTLDGVAVAVAPIAIGGSGYGTIRVQLGAGNAGAHVLTASSPVGIQVLGYGSYTSYQYPGGLDLTLIAGKPAGG